MTIHPSALVEPGAELDSDVVVGPFCYVHAGARLERGVVLDSHVVVYSGTTVGEGTRVYPQAVLGGDPQSANFDPRTPSGVRTGARCVVREGATVHRATAEGEETVVGDGTMLMALSHVGHDCRIGNGVVVTSYVGVSGHCEIEDFAVIGGFTAVHQKVRVGTMAMIAGWSRVTVDCPPYIITAGVPAAPHSLNLVALRRRGVPEESRSALKSAYRLLYRSDLNTTQAIERIAAEVPDCAEVEGLVRFIRGVAEGAKGRGLEH